MKGKRAISRKTLVVSVVFCLILLASLLGALSYKEMINTKDEIIQSKNSQIQGLLDQINQLQTWLNNNETLLSLTKMWLESNVSRADSLNVQIASLEADIQSLVTQISSLDDQIAAFQTQINLLNETAIHTDGTTLQDAFGNAVYLKGIEAARNERRAENGSFWSIDDVRRMKEAGATCLELHEELISDWMPNRNQINETYFVNWLDKEVTWCTQYSIYCIIDLRNFNGRTDWERQEPFLPNWLWNDLGYSEPTSPELTNLIVRDFFDTDVQKQDINREAFINCWKFVANRYKDNKYVLFSIMNEPLAGVELNDSATSIHFGITYSRFMERVVDAIRSTGAKQIVIINKPYLWDFSDIQPVNRDNIMWEDHLYVESNMDINAWKDGINAMIQRFVHDFGKPLFIGEYGTDNPIKPVDWQDILSEEVAYLKSEPVCGRQWHCWDWINGEYGDYEYHFFSAEESAWIIETVLG